MKHVGMKNVGRKTKAIIAVISSTAAVVAAVGVVPSLAGWTHTEVDNGTLSSLDCSTPGNFTTQGWGQEIAGEVETHSLDSHLAGALGITVNSGAPASTSTGGVGSDPAGRKYLGNDAWHSVLNAGALNAIGLGIGVTLPIGANTGVETQYGRATSSGQATGASGALTDAGGGLVSLATPSSTDPGVGSIDLSDALSATIGKKLGDISQLADASLDVGALGSTTSVDSCNDLWQGVSDASQVVRKYVLAKLALNFNSSLVGDTVTDTTSTVNTLQTQLNALESGGSILGLGTVSSALTTAISHATSLAAVTIGGPTTVTAGVTFDLSPVLSDLTETVSDPTGAVSVNLGTGAISVDLAKLLDSHRVNLNGLDPNTSLLTPDLLGDIETDAASAITGFLGGTLTTDLDDVLNAAKVNVEVKTDIKIAGLDAAALDIHIKGTLGQFLSPTPTSQPTVTIDPPAIVGGVVGLLAFLGIDLTTVLTAVTTGLVSPLLTGLVPAIAGVLTTNVVNVATGDITSAVGSLSTTTLAPVFAALDVVVGVIGDAVQLTVNAQPDQAGGVGVPDSAPGASLYDSALYIGVLDLSGGTAAPTLDLYLGSSGVGPNAPN